MSKNRPIYLKVVVGKWENASRDKRELRVAEELGFSVIVIATTKEEKKVLNDEVDGFRVIRVPTRLYGNSRVNAVLGRI